MSRFDWPRSLQPLNVNIRPPRKTVGLNTSLSEFTQAVPSIRPPFGLTLEFDNLFGRDVLAYRALLAMFEGRANTVRIPLFDVWFAATDAQIGGGLVTHSDGTTFSDGALYLTDDLSGVTVTGLQGARTITADFGTYGRLLEAGLYFGMGDHPYIATGVWWEGTVATIRFSPSLRVDYVDAELRLRPVMIAGLPNDDTGDLMLKSMRYGAPALDLVERFDGLLS